MSDDFRNELLDAGYKLQWGFGLSELIEACGEDFYGVTIDTAKKWHAWRGPSQCEGHLGFTPEEAVARLWLNLNRKV